MGYYFCNKCRCKHPIDLGCPQTTTNRTLVVPKEGLNLYELDLAMGVIPPDTTYEEWRAMQNETGEITEYGENA